MENRIQRFLSIAACAFFASALTVSLTAAEEQASPTLKVLYTFLGAPTDGAAVNAALVVDAAGNFWGTTIGGGPSSCNYLGLPPQCGTVFKLSPPASGSGPYTETILHYFLGGTADGAEPQGGIVRGPGGSWFGTTDFGATGAPGFGNIYELTPNGATFNYNQIIVFSDAIGSAAIPENNMTYYKGILYTTTQNGGAFGNFGTIIQLVPQGSTWNYIILHSFDGTDGASIQGGLAVDQTSGTFYGVAQNGGTANQGTIFQLIPPAGGSGAWTFNKLYDFTGGNDGGYIYGSAVLGPKGVLYGTAQNFGQFGGGTVWTMTPTSAGGFTFKVIHQFAKAPSDGAAPVANVIVTAAGVIYGTTELGGTHNKGTLFRLAPAAGGGYTETILWNFTGGADGSFPYAAPTLVRSNVLVGSSARGGSTNSGVIWEVTF